MADISDRVTGIDVRMAKMCARVADLEARLEQAEALRKVNSAVLNGLILSQDDPVKVIDEVVAILNDPRKALDRLEALLEKE